MITTRIKGISLLFRRNMTSVMNEILTPIGVRGMTCLDRDKFKRNVLIPVLKVSEENLGKLMQSCKKYYFKAEHFKPVQNIEDEIEKNKKYIHLHPHKIKQWSDIDDEDRRVLEKYKVTEENFCLKEVLLTYENWRVDQIFKSVLPENEDIVSGFSQIGHIVHLNLRDHLLEYRPFIGQVLLDKIKTCRTVINKSTIIDNTYRNFSMEVIAGDNDFNVNVRENHCTFEFDFSKVYWNPRLGREHERILTLMKPEDILFDVFCGVGPFAIPAAKQKCKVFANDLNPESYKWLNHNAKINKINPDLFKSYNEDGGQFIETVFKNYIKSYCEGNESIPSKLHVTMNLPALAVEFLKHFNGLLKDEDSSNFNCNILIHVYCFTVGDDPQKLAKEMVVQNIKNDITPHIVEIFNVRNVSPKKEMMRVSFRLTNDVLFGLNSVESEVEGPPSKKLCINDCS